MEKHDPTFGDLNRLMAITQSLDERGLVLSLAAFADDALADLILAFMQPGEAAKSLVEGFNAPLGTFSARIKAASSLGLITDRQHKNLDRLRRIRNEFAHKWDNISLNDQPVAAHIAALKFSPMVEKFPENSSEKLRLIISSLLTEIRSCTHQISVRNLSTRTTGFELVPGLSSEFKNEVPEYEIRLSETNKELKNAKGERRDYLLAQQERWTALLRIVRTKMGTRGNE